MKSKSPFFYNGKEYETLYELLCDLSIENMQQLYDAFEKKDEDFCSFVKDNVPEIFKKFYEKKSDWISFFKKLYETYISGYSENKILKMRLENLMKVREQEQLQSALKEHLEIAANIKAEERQFENIFKIIPPDQRNTITFGKYPFNDDGSEEPLEWLEVASMDDKILVCSCHGIDAIPFNDTKQDNDFDSSSLAAWLKSDFVNRAFNDSEKMRIEEGPFILTAQEVESYFPENNDRTISPSPYAAKRGVPLFKNGCSWWWLATPGSMKNTAAYTSYSGKVKLAGDFVYLASVAVRPAIIIKKENSK